MSWTKDFSRGAFRIFSGNTIEGFQPLDFYHFFPQWYDVWIERITEVMDRFNVEQKSFQELKSFLPPPSNLRAILIKIIPSYRAFVVKDFGKIKRVVEFLVRMLQESCVADPFALVSNPYHREEEVKEIVKHLDWIEGEPGIARKLGQLNTAAGSLVHGLFNDVVTDLGWDVYGPYAVSQQGQAYTMLIRHFPDLRPHELWSEQHLASVRELMVYGLYQDVEWEIAYVGCHTIPKNGNPIQGLKKYVVVADGRVLSQEEVNALVEELSRKAETIYREIRTLSFEDLKQKVLLQECYQLKKLFDAAGMDWRPTEEMRSRVIDKPLLEGVLPKGVMMTDQAVFEEVFGIRLFEREVLGENT